MAAVDRGDVPELALGDQVDRFDPEPGRELAVERARRAAALDVAEPRALASAAVYLRR